MIFTLTISIYVAVLLLISITIYEKIRNPYILNTIILLIYFALIAFRPNTLPDNQPYIDLYQNYQTFSFNINHFNILDILNNEIGFYALLSISKTIFGNNYKLFFILISIINLILFYKGSLIIINKTDNENLKSNKNIFLLLFLIYISYYGFMYNLIVLRASIAISLLYYAIALKINNKNLGFTLILVLSFMFHRSASLGIFVSLSLFIIPAFSKRKYLALWLMLFLLYIFRVNTFFDDFNLNQLLNLSQLKNESLFGAYIANDYAISRYSLRTLYLLLIAPIIILANKSNNKTYFKLINLFLIGLSVQILFEGIPALGRATDFFIFFSVILSYLSVMNMKNLTNKYVFLSLIIIANTIIFLRLGAPNQ